MCAQSDPGFQQVANVPRAIHKDSYRAEMPFVSWRNLMQGAPSTFLVSIVFLVVLQGCSDSDRVAKRGPVDFIGEVKSVVFDVGWAMDPIGLALGGPDSDVTLGPQLITLVDGQQLDVPAATPGGNNCPELIHPSLGDLERRTDPTNHCVIMGQRGVDGRVAWYEVLNVGTPNGPARADIGYVAEIDAAAGTMTTKGGFEFPLAADESDCGFGLEFSDVAAVRAFADWTTGEVVVLVCLFDM